MKKLLCIALCLLIIVSVVGFVGCDNSRDCQHKHYYIKETVVPTCTHDGYSVYSCRTCGYKTLSDYTSALQTGGHQYKNFVCTDCGDFLIDQATDTETLSYTKSTDELGNEIYTVTGITENSEYIKIPSTYNGIPVKRIADKAFYNLLNLKHVIIPDSVVSIGKSAFQYCLELISIDIPKSITQIGEKAFSNCQNLKIISIPNLTLIPEAAFIGCSSISDIVIPQGVTAIDINAFSGCKNLVSITIPVSVTAITHAAFMDCSSLQEIYYQGTTEQWTAICKETGKFTNTETDASWDANTGNYIIHCSNGQIEKLK